ncbi:MAG: hypothetical protein NTU85_02140 [Candidatus Kaiserbacteria bacterium]|nr:hypothetical protein [Candidatus Kaiserbacteria bacterium]
MTFAQFVGSSTTGIIGILNTVVIPIILAFAFFAFVWGVLNYFFFSNRGDEEKLKEGRQFIFWGILGIVVLFSIWGFLNLLLSTLGITPT